MSASPEMIDRVTRPFGAYDRPLNVREDAEITHVGPGTPCGEYLRRMWQPVILSQELGDLPQVVQMLGEDLVVFRTLKGDVGVLDRNCSHRGASLEYALPTPDGIQCCYHGWHFAKDGEILDTPNDPESTVRERICHPAYPAIEYKGIIFAWMGPPDDVPEFPILDSYDQPDTATVPFSLTFPCNWLQILDNCQDPTHSCFLHTRVSGIQFAESWGELPELDYLRTPIGTINVNVRRWKDKVWARTGEIIMPNMNQAGALWLTAEEEVCFIRTSLTRWMRPIDDANTRVIGWRYFNDRVDPDGEGDRSQVGSGKIDFIGQTEDERPYAERQRIPGDFEAIVSQRPIVVHALENLTGGDRGVALLRQVLQENIRQLQAGEDYMSLTRQKGSVIPTYTQDTVWSLTPREGNADRELMQDAGAQIAELVIDSAELPTETRENVFLERAVKIAVELQSSTPERP